MTDPSLPEDVRMTHRVDYDSVRKRRELVAALAGGGAVASCLTDLSLIAAFPLAAVTFALAGRLLVARSAFFKTKKLDRSIIKECKDRVSGKPKMLRMLNL